MGRTWKEAAQPPAFAKPAEGGAPAHLYSRCPAVPKKVGDIGFDMVVHPRDDNTAWTFDMALPLQPDDDVAIVQALSGG